MVWQVFSQDFFQPNSCRMFARYVLLQLSFRLREETGAHALEEAHAQLVQELSKPEPKHCENINSYNTRSSETTKTIFYKNVHCIMKEKTAWTNK